MWYLVREPAGQIWLSECVPFRVLFVQEGRRQREAHRCYLWQLSVETCVPCRRLTRQHTAFSYALGHRAGSLRVLPRLTVPRHELWW